MSKSLIITEKQSVAEDIVRALGGFKAADKKAYWESDSFIVTYAKGHLLEFFEPEDIDPAFKQWKMDTLPIIPKKFEFKPKSRVADRVRVIKKLFKRDDISEVINACDAGREGELIFRELIDYLKVKLPTKRLWLQSMTTDAIRAGFQRLEDGRQYDRLGDAALCRSKADWLIGMNASRAYTIRMRRGATRHAWSAGRVQTPTLSLLVERELQVLEHIPVPFFRIKGEFAAKDHTYQASYYDPNFKADDLQPHLEKDRIFDEKTVDDIIAAVTNNAGQAREVRKPSNSAAPKLFDLTSLQREANNRFGWSARRTLRAAQACYETHKVLTYPRTDSKCLPSDYVAHVEKVVDELTRVNAYQKAAVTLKSNGRQNDKIVFNNKGVSDHFAIIPTGVISSKLEGDDARLFDLVTRRFMAAFFPPAVYESTSRHTVVAGHHFVNTARTLKKPGWQLCFDGKAGDGDFLPNLLEGQDKADGVEIKNNSTEKIEDATKPPPRIGEAKLLDLMERAGKDVEDEDVAEALSGKGLGTPATRADIIENLKQKEYVDNKIRPTVKGIRFIDLLKRIKSHRITSAELTGEVELHLSEVEKGERDADEFMKEIFDYTTDIVETAKQFTFPELFPDEEPLGTCPACGRTVYERGFFYRCKEDPDLAEKGLDCPFRIWKDKSGRYIDRVTAQTLLENGRTGEIDGFRDLQGRGYKAILAIKDKEVVMEPVAGMEEFLAAADPTFEVNPEPLGPSPLDPNDMVIETPTRYIAVKRKEAEEKGVKKLEGFVLPRTVCRRTMTREEAQEYMKNKETPFFEDFISRKGRPFKAKLKVKDNGKHEFEFAPRKKKAPAKKAGDAAEGDDKKTTKKKAASKKTTKKTTTKKKSTAKKKAPAKKKTASKKTASKDSDS